MAGRNFLFVPGPTNTPDRILRAMHRAMEDHRSSDFPGLSTPLFEDLKKIFKTTSGQAFIFPASGTGAWEASLANTLSPGDKVLAARFGMFSHLWIDMAQRFGLEVEVLDTEWGEGAPVERYRDALAADKSHRIKALLFTHNETATGVTSDVAGVRRALDETGHPALLMVDGVSSIASIDFRMDDWRVDLAVTGSQKGLMLPAGLGIVCASQKALARYDEAKLPRCFFDFGDMRKANPTGYFPYTPSLPMLYGLRESLAMLLEEGLENVFARHRRLAEGTRQAVKAWGLELCARAPKWNSDTVTVAVTVLRSSTCLATRIERAVLSKSDRVGAWAPLYATFCRLRSRRKRFRSEILKSRLPRRSRRSRSSEKKTKRPVSGSMNSSPGSRSGSSGATAENSESRMICSE